MIDEWYKGVFLTLSRGRHKTGNGISPLSMQEMIFYFEHFGSPYPYDISCSILSHIDVEVLEYFDKKQEAKRKSQQKVKKGR